MGLTMHFVIILVASAPNFSLCGAKNHTKDSCRATQNIRCKDGVILPAWLTPGNDSGEGWAAVKAFVYFVVMFMLFLGISIISDRFMAAIEVITSHEKEITMREESTGKTQIVMVKIWNETVANLSLMALGSSAPEILLSVIEIIGRGFEAGELGPSTVVGSAAFNLFMITAVCVSVLPDGEVRRIKHLNVFAFTASCSLFAYIWMYVMIAVSSPGVIQVWEGIITLICFPGMVGVSYLIDTGINPCSILRKKVQQSSIRLKRSSVGNDIVLKKGKDDIDLEVDDPTDYERETVELLAYREGDDVDTHMKEKKRLLVEAYHKVKQRYPDANHEAMQQLVEEENRKMQPKTRAFYRIQAVRTHTGQGGVFKKPDQTAVMERLEESVKEAKSHEYEEGIYFSPCDYTVVESCGTCEVTVLRYGPSISDTVEVDYETLDGSAIAGDDYVEAKGTLMFAPGETLKTIAIKINDDDVFELDEHFYCKLTLARSNNKERPVHIGDAHTAKITIIDDDYPGIFTIENGRYEIMESIGVLTVRVLRKFGARGMIRIPWHTEEDTAKGFGYDFDDDKGEVVFDNEEFVKNINVLIIDKEEYAKDKLFKIILGDPVIVQTGEEDHNALPLPQLEIQRLSKIIQAGMAALGEHKETEIHIVECQEFRSTIDSMLRKRNMASFWKSSTWHEQFKEAFHVEAGDENEDNEKYIIPSYYDYLMHYLSLPWKVMFAFVPPTDIMNGWACFWVSIAMIGVLTAVTGDIASHFGCTIGLADSVVAMSFVALGTSLPDTFASKVATINDETADSSIGNITGSNSVNVFLGIGAAWSLAAFYHAAHGGQFEVDPGTLGFSVLIFCIEAIFCITILMFRRFNKAIGAELGGPRIWNWITSATFACLWFIYILLSSLQTYCHIEAPF